MNFIKKYFLISLLGFLTPAIVYGASFSIAPSSGSVYASEVGACAKTVDIILDTEGGETNGAQIYIEHNFNQSGESISISGGGLFNTYSIPSDLPAGIVGLVGYGGNKSGSNLRFARITIRSPIVYSGQIKNLTIKFSNDLITSKVADSETSGNILSSVNGASYTVAFGYCESIPPSIINISPPHQTPNYPTTEPITFSVEDAGSGVDIDTLDVNVLQDGWNGSYDVNYTKQSDNLYSVTVVQDSAFQSEVRVDWSVSVADKAGNTRNASYYYNHVSCADLGCGVGGEPDCNDGIDNDGDGDIDMIDAGCESFLDNNESDDGGTVTGFDCSDGVDNDGDGLIDSGDGGCLDELGEYNPNDNNEYLPKCNDGIDNDGDGLIDYPADTDCASADQDFEKVGQPCDPGTCPVLTTQCNDGIDNDGDGLVDVNDTGCSNDQDNNEYVVGDIGSCPVCEGGTSGGTSEVFIYQCKDGIDNDGDGLFDLDDLDCESSNDNSEYYMVPGSILDVSDLDFYLNNRSIKTDLNSYNTLPVLSSRSLAVAVNTGKITNEIKNVDLWFKDTNYDLYYDNALGDYVVDLNSPGSPGSYSGVLTVEYGSDGMEVLPFNILVLPEGVIIGQTDDGYQNLPETTVYLEQLSNDNEYKLISSQKTDIGGGYGFVVPNGAYRLRIEKNGYLVNKTSGFKVNNFIINRSVGLIRIVDLLDPDVAFGEKINFIGEVAGQQAGGVIGSLNDPAVENTAKIVAPVAVAATAAMALPALSLINLLSYLRFLFLQPVLLFGRKKRKDWGIVYNSLTKLPVDLATVRLIDAQTDAIVQTRVTDSNGRYMFFVESGVYRIVVSREGNLFPTKILQGVEEDGGFLKIYHGEPIHIDDERGNLSVNIPLDPVGANKTPKRILLNKIFKSSQQIIARLSIFIGIVALIITPTITVGLLLLFQIILYFAFRRLAVPKRIKNWGVVYDKKTKKSLKRVIVRLFDSEFNKLIATQITDGKGRYSFLVGKSKYYITYELAGYEKYKGGDVNLLKDEEGILSKDVGLISSDNTKK